MVPKSFCKIKQVNGFDMFWSHNKLAIIIALSTFDIENHEFDSILVKLQHLCKVNIDHG